MKKYAVLLAFVMSAISVPASAGTIGFVFDTQFSNNVNPASTGPWAGALFNDAPVGGLTAGYDVRLTIFTNGPSSGLTGTEFLTEIDFNISAMTATNDGEFNSIIVNAGNGALGAVGTDPFTFGLNFEQADGDGLYDMTANFSSNPPRATTGNVYVIDIQWTGGTLLASHFNALSAPGGNSGGPFYAATHIQGIGNNSTWAGASRLPCIGCATPFDVNPVAAPEPASLMLLGSGLVGLAVAVKRRRKA